ncbi:MAG: DNA methylase, partial [Clostridia bacterium]|nr:DNA methylase [Clostridia bacterium]
FEARQAIRAYEKANHTQVKYIVAVPRMAEYERVSALIYSVYLRYAAPEDIHVYSIDECFIDCTPYLHLYAAEAARTGTEPAQCMAMTMIRDVLRETGITATVGIGTNLYLAKVAMDIVAKKAPADENGVRIAALNEDSYKFLLWGHRPLTDFWQIGPGKANRLLKGCMFTMGDVARRSLTDQEWFYKTFGIDAEILIDHAWGIEPVTMQDIKNYRSDSHSVSTGQVLPRPYAFHEARLVFTEMADVLCSSLFTKHLVSSVFPWWASYDYKSLDAFPEYSGRLAIDFYGRLHPYHSNGTVRLAERTNAVSDVTAALLKQFDAVVHPRLLIRRLGISACDTRTTLGERQLSFFTDDAVQEKEQSLQQAMLSVRQRFGASAIFRGLNLEEGATALERSRQIGGHRA